MLDQDITAPYKGGNGNAKRRARARGRRKRLYQRYERGGGKHSLGRRLRLLRSKVFFKRYILRNAISAYNRLFRTTKITFLRKIAYHKRFNWVLSLPFGLFFGLYFVARFLRGKVDMPYFDIALTTKCTLRCEACMNMMQYSADSHQLSALSVWGRARRASSCA